MQTALVVITLLLCAGYAAWRTYRVLTGKCSGCEACALHRYCKEKK